MQYVLVVLFVAFALHYWGWVLAGVLAFVAFTIAVAMLTPQKPKDAPAFRKPQKPRAHKPLTIVIDIKTRKRPDEAAEPDFPCLLISCSFSVD